MMSFYLLMKKMRKVENHIRIADRLKNVYHEQTVLAVFGPEGGLSRKEAETLRCSRFSYRFHLVREFCGRKQLHCIYCPQCLTNLNERGEQPCLQSHFIRWAAK